MRCASRLDRTLDTFDLETGRGRYEARRHGFAVPKQSPGRRGARPTVLGAKNPNWKNAGLRTCVGCDTVFKRYNKAAKFCSHACYAATVKGTVMAHYRGMPRRVDGNHREIVDALRQAGCPVIDISSLGGGAPDIIVLRRDKSITLFEIKNPATHGKLNALQESWHLQWAGAVHVVRTVEEALRLAGVVTHG